MIEYYTCILNSVWFEVIVFACKRNRTILILILLSLGNWKIMFHQTELNDIWYPFLYPFDDNCNHYGIRKLPLKSYVLCPKLLFIIHAIRNEWVNSQSKLLIQLHKHVISEMVSIDRFVAMSSLIQRWTPNLNHKNRFHNSPEHKNSI